MDMKKILFGIFAHPDDEAFGPSGTLLSEVRAGTNVHLITLTAGEAGTNPDDVPDLAETRLAEWRAAGKLIGATSQTFFGYKDGHLDNLAMIEIAARIEAHIIATLEHYPADTVVECMSIDLNGVTGHIDHIVAGRATCLAFYRLKARGVAMKQLRLACLKDTPENTQWLYMEAGRRNDEIGMTVDNREYAATIRAIIAAHHSQRHDGEAHIRQRGDTLGVDYFIVKT